jgi:cytoskeletal protein CcmA (bactofilin family)
MRGFFPWLVATGVLSAIAVPLRQSRSAEIRSGEEVVIKEAETIRDDLYAFGRHITIDGTVEGDVIAFGEQITVNGTVKGDVIAAGQTVVLNGAAEGARIAGQVLKLGSKAKLERDVVAAGLSLECAKDSSVGGDALYAGYQALFAGSIKDEVRAAMSNCRLEGSIGGDVNLEVGGEKNAPPATAFGPPPPVPMPNVASGFTIADSAAVDGNLNYTAPREATIGPQAQLKGKVDYHAPAPKAKGATPAAAKKTALAKVFGRLRHVACVLIVGLATLLILPRWSDAWADTIRTRPLASFASGLAGLAAFIVLLVVAVIAIVFVALALGIASLSELVPMVVVGGIVGYIALILAFWLLVAFLAEAIAGLAVGRLAIHDEGLTARLGAMVVGVIAIAILLSVPYVGSLLGFVVIMFAIGSICLSLFGPAPPQSFAPPPPGKPIPSALG